MEIREPQPQGPITIKNEVPIKALPTPDKLPISSLPETEKAISEQRRIIGLQSITGEGNFPPQIASLYHQNETFVGKKVIPNPGTHEEFKVTGMPNGILTIQKRKKQSNILFFIPHYSIEEYYFIDTKSKKGYELHEMLEKNTAKPYTFESVPSFGSSAVVPMKDKNVVILNDFSDLPLNNKAIQKLGFSKEDGEIMDMVAPFHEAAHVLQNPKTSSKDTSLAPIIIKDYLNRKILLPIALWFIKKIGSSKKISEIKGQKVWGERNASAFALNKIRSLKKQGVDLLRNHNPSIIAKTIDKALLSYDMGFGIYLPGEHFSQRVRKIANQIKSGSKP